MAYSASGNLPFEAASKLGHISIVNDPFIKEMVQSFREIKRDPAEKPDSGFEIVDADCEPLDFVVAIDGSMSTIPNALAPQKTLSYVKIAALNVSLKELARVQAPVVNPESVQRILSNYADTESTVLPLSNVHTKGRTLSQTIRHALEATFTKLQDGMIYDTLEYLVSYGWDEAAEPWRAGSGRRPYFFCPLCEQRVDFPRF